MTGVADITGYSFQGPKDATGVDKKGKPTKDSTDLVNMVNRCYKQAGQVRRQHDAIALTCAAFNSGKQWVEWNPATSSMQNVPGYDWADRSHFITDPHIERVFEHALARVTAKLPSVWAAPDTDSQKDKDAAAEARAILSHCAKVNQQQRLVVEWNSSALEQGIGYIKCVWDKDRDAQIALGMTPEGIGEIVTKPIGDVRENALLSLDVYVDPRASRFHEAVWVIHASVQSLSDIRAKYPEKGHLVTASSADGEYGTMEQRLAAIDDEYYKSNLQVTDSAVVLEYWQKPPAKPIARPQGDDPPPNGRLLTVAGNVLLRSEDWPYETRDKYPFIPLVNNPLRGSIYGQGMIWRLIGLQRALNRAASNWTTWLEFMKPNVLVREGSEISTDSYTLDRWVKKIYYAGEAPEFQVTPPPGNVFGDFTQWAQGQIDDIAGFHDISEDERAGASDISGFAMQLRQAADMTRLGPYITSQLEPALVEWAEWRLAHYLQFVVDKENPQAVAARMLAIDDVNDGEKAAAKAYAFESLSSGGSCRVGLTAGSGMPDLPAAKQERVDMLFKEGLLGNPGTPEGAANYFALSKDFVSSDTTDEIVQRLAEAEAKAAAMQPNPMAVQQAQDAAAMQRLQMELAAKAQSAGEIAAANAHAKEEQIKVQGEKDMQLAAYNHQEKMQSEADNREAELAKAMLTAHAATMPKVSIAGKLTPGGELAAEHEVGLEGGTLADAKAVTIPPKPVAPGAKPSGSKQDG